MTIAVLVLLDVVVVALLVVVAVRPIIHRFRQQLGGQRLGRLSIAGTPTAEAIRHERLRQLGEARTYRVHNCGTILHVDYERGELIVEREGR